jgi:hydrogenase nickel incorporation protein HypA/HybF
VHELGITQNIVAIVQSHAGTRNVRRVKLEIGKLSAILPDAVRFCFDVCAEGTVLQGAVLEIVEVEGRGLCKQCNREIPLSLLAGICTCGSREISCTSGEELNIKEMEVE